MTSSDDSSFRPLSFSNQGAADQEIAPATRPIDATIRLPGSKSYTNRALLIAALAAGRSRLRQALFSDDTRYMATALNALGIPVSGDEAAREFVVDGQGGRIPKRQASLFIGNSGTAARFLTAFVALGAGSPSPRHTSTDPSDESDLPKPFPPKSAGLAQSHDAAELGPVKSPAECSYLIDGSERMRERPIQPLLDALASLGVNAESLKGTGCPPVRIQTSGLTGGRVRLPGNLSSQYLSALLLVAPATALGIEISIVGELVSRPFLALTAASMRAFGVEKVELEDQRVAVPPGQSYQPREYSIEPDASAASYFFAAAALTGGRARVEGIGGSSAQGDLGFVDLLAQMGCSITRAESYVEVIGPANGQLRGIAADMRGISDTFLTLAALAPFANSPTEITGIGHTRHQESDRVAAAATELRRLGATVEERRDSLVIQPANGQLHGAAIETYDDHRVAMSFALCGLRVPGVRIRNPGCIAKTFSDYFATLAAVTSQVSPSGSADRP